MAAAEHRYKQDAREREGGSFSVRVNHVCTFLSSETCEQQEFCWRGARGGVSLKPPVMTVICSGFETLLFLWFQCLPPRQRWWNSDCGWGLCYSMIVNKTHKMIWTNHVLASQYFLAPLPFPRLSSSSLWIIHVDMSEQDARRCINNLLPSIYRRPCHCACWLTLFVTRTLDATEPQFYAQLCFSCCSKSK